MNKKMKKPEVKRQEKAACVACGLVVMNPAIVTFPCAVTPAGIAA